MEGTLLVDPGTLQTTSSAFSAKANDINTLQANMVSKVDSLSGAWTGDAAEAYRNKFKSLQPSMDKIFKMISTHSRNLNDMASEFIRGESTASSLANELPASNL